MCRFRSKCVTPATRMTKEDCLRSMREAYPDEPENCPCVLFNSDLEEHIDNF